MPNDVADLRLDCLAGLLLRGHQDEVSVPFTLADATQVEPQEPEGFPVQHVHHLGFLPVQLDAERRELFLEPLQGPFGPAPFGSGGR